MLSLIIKILILVALIGIGVLIYMTCAGTPIIQKIDQTLPDSASAPFEVSTRTKIYMAQKAVLNDDQSVTMYGWYERSGKKWIFHEEAVTLPPLFHPRIGRR